MLMLSFLPFPIPPFKIFISYVFRVIDYVEKFLV